MGFNIRGRRLPGLYNKVVISLQLWIPVLMVNLPDFPNKKHPPKLVFPKIKRTFSAVLVLRIIVFGSLY